VALPRLHINLLMEKGFVGFGVKPNTCHPALQSQVGNSKLYLLAVQIFGRIWPHGAGYHSHMCAPLLMSRARIDAANGAILLVFDHRI
jgi:hypothetical protein